MEENHIIIGILNIDKPDVVGFLCSCGEEIAVGDWNLTPLHEGVSKEQWAILVSVIPIFKKAIKYGNLTLDTSKF